MDRQSESSDLANRPGFLQHVFNFSEEGKGELLNIIQYAILSIIPIVVLNKSIQKLIPEADDTKGTVEILAEVLFQILSMFVGIVLINRMITYVPTYSGIKYSEVNLITIVLGFLMVVFSIQTKLGEKTNLLLGRLTDLWDGSSSSNKRDNGKQVPKDGGRSPSHQPSQADNIQSSALGLLPQGPPGLPNSLSAPPPPQPVQQQQQSAPQHEQSFNHMYAGPDTPLVGANEPAAANAFPSDAFSGLF